MSVTGSFVRLQDFNDGQFCSFTRFQWQSVFNVSQFCSATRTQYSMFCSFHYKISMMIGYVLLQDFNDLQICWVMRFQWLSVLFHYKISMTIGFVSLFFYEISKTVGFVSLRDFSDGRFCSFKAGRHQADADELVVTKADCRVGSCRQRHVVRCSTADGQVVRPFCVCVRWNVFLYQLVAVAEQPIRMIRWPDWPTSSNADSTCRIGRKQADEDQLQPTVRNTQRKLSQPTNKNCPTTDRRLGVFLPLGVLNSRQFHSFTRSQCLTIRFV